MSTRLCLAAAIVVVSLAVVPATSAQKGSGSNSNAGKSNTTTSFPSTTNPSTTASRPMDTTRTIFLSGKVVMAEGGPPPEPVAVERVCGGGAPHRDGYTDSKGHFSLTLGNAQPSVLPDASEASGFGSGMGSLGQPQSVSERQLWNCELIAVEPGYTSSRINLAGRHAMDNPDVGTIVLSHIANVSGSTISVTSLAAPPNAKKEYEKARELMAKKKLPDAEQHATKAVTIYPKYASAWELLGELQSEQNRAADARKSFEQAVAADGSYVTPYLHLALIAASERNWPEVMKFTDSALRLDSVDLVSAWFYRSVAQFNLNQMADAEKSARKAEEIDKNHQFPRVELLVGDILQRKGDYVGAAQHLRLYLALDPNASDATQVRAQLAQSEQAASLAARNAGTAK